MNSELSQFVDAPVASVIFLMTLLISFRALQNPVLLEKLMFIPVRVARQSEYYRLLSAGFVHANWWHLGLNMLAFYFFAFYLESNPYAPSLSLGHWQFLLVYIGSMLISKFPSFIRHKDDYTFRSLGASGAISGVVMAAIMLAPDMQLAFIFLPFFTFPAWIAGVGYIIYSLVASFYGKGRINHDAHLFGALGGIVLAPLVKPEIVFIVKSWLMGVG